MALSKEKKKGCFYTEISPCLIVGEKGCIAYSCKSHFQTFKILTSENGFSRFDFQTSEIPIHVLHRFTFELSRTRFKFTGSKSQPLDLVVENCLRKFPSLTILRHKFEEKLSFNSKHETFP